MPNKRGGYCGLLGVDPSFAHPESGIVSEMNREATFKRLKEQSVTRRELLKKRIVELGLENCGPENPVGIKFEHSKGEELELWAVGVTSPEGNLILQHPDGRRYKNKVNVLSEVISVIKE